MEGEIVSLGDREHLLLRPDTLCGSTTPSEHAMHVFNPRAEVTAAKPTLRDQFEVVTRTLLFAPAVRNLFQEILTNALDRQFRDDTMRRIEVWVDCAEAGGPGWVRVKNDGQGVPVVFDEARGAWKPTIAFSHFRSGSNFVDDAGPRWTAGRNGYGCKATNVFSAQFRVHTADPREGKQLTQHFRDNMAVVPDPVIKPFKLKRGFTDIQFLLDWSRLGGFTPDVATMIRTTTVYASACLTKDVTLCLNGVPLGVHHFRHFGAAFGCSDAVAYDGVKSEDGKMMLWEVAAVRPGDGGVKELGFVNSLEVSEGTHMSLALNRIVTAVEETMRSRYKRGADFSVSPAAVRKRLFLSAKLMVDSPEFSSQTKERLTTSSARFGFKWTPSAAFMRGLGETGLIEELWEEVQAKELASARKTMASTTATGPSRRMVIADKYDAATSLRTLGAGRSQCSLLVTEGDSARALAVAGLAVLGRERYGIFALKGKPLNVRNASVDAISKNKEISTLLAILGLTLGKPVTSLAQLNYKKLVIFSDQDPDGAHIGGLVLNVIHALFPSLLALDPAFVQRFPTPLVRLTDRAGAVQCFYAKASFDEWVASQAADWARRYTVKYYKGLGTSTSALAREYFSAYSDSLVDIVWTGASDAIMAQMFGQENAAARRALLTDHYDPRAYVDYRASSVTYSDFVLKEVLPYSHYSNERNIPSVLDGFKPVQRKALYTFLEGNITADVKVAQVAARVAARTMYHHGEASLVETVVGMAQDHVGISNLNLLRPEGQFGSRLDPPSVHSAARYIFTGLDPVTRALFPKADDAVLTYCEDEGVRIEPVVFLPVIPMVLVNGAFGIGTGWSTSVPMFDPLALVEVMRAWIRAPSSERDAVLRELCAPQTLMPWFDGFKGRVEYLESRGVYRTHGIYTEEAGRVHITELPVGTWTHAYVEDVEKRLCPSPVSSIDKQWTDSSVDMVLHCDPGAVPTPDALNMWSEVRVSNMHLYNADGKLTHYRTVADIVAEYAPRRLALYETRRLYGVDVLQKELDVLHAKHRFVSAVCSGELVLHRQSDESVEASLISLGVPRGDDGTFDYLLSMSLKSTTATRLSKLEADMASTSAELERMKTVTPDSLWLADLDAAALAIQQFRVRKAERYASSSSSSKKEVKGGAKAKPAKKARVA